MNLDQRLHETAFDSFGGKNMKSIGKTKTAKKAKTKKETKLAKKLTGPFSDLGIDSKLLNEIDRLDFSEPTPIQKEAIPAAIKGDDIIAIAKTGSGKTLAFGIPMLQRLSKSKKGTGLVLVPTRELALQVEEAIRSVSRMTFIRSTVLIGGAAMSLQRKALNKNPRIIIATPGRLMDHLERKTVNLSNVEVFILDEADRMLDMGFVPDIKKIMKHIPETRQTMLFSATMPKQIETIAASLMENPTRVEVDQSGVTPVEVSHEMFFITNHDKKRLLAMQLKKYTGPVLVFTRTKRMASKLTKKVDSMGFAVAEIHSDRSLGQRRNALDGFKQGRYQVLIATDIAARGIDVSGIELVVNYDMPATTEDYVHRTGRTGRAGKTGHASSYVTSEQRGYVRSLERFMKTKLPVSTLPTLPTEAFLIREADKQKLKAHSDTFVDERPEKKPKRKSSKERSSTRMSSSTRRDSDKFGIRKSSSKKFAPKRADSEDRYPKKSSSKKFAPKKSDSEERSFGNTGFKKSGIRKSASKKFTSRRPDSEEKELRKSRIRKSISRNYAPRRPGTDESDFIHPGSNEFAPKRRGADAKPLRKKQIRNSDSDRPDSKRRNSKPSGRPKKGTNASSSAPKSKSSRTSTSKPKSSRTSASDRSGRQKKGTSASASKPKDSSNSTRWSKFTKSRPTKKKKITGQITKRKKKAKKK